MVQNKFRRKFLTLYVVIFMFSGLTISNSATACSSEPLLGSMCVFAGNFAPRGYMFAHGQLLAISKNSALFSLIGTTYGGDGRTTFALPDTRGRVLIGAGDGPFLPAYSLGEKGTDGNATDKPAKDGKEYLSRMSYVAVNWIIAVKGIYPSRNK